MKMTNIRTYTELTRLSTFEERYAYLRLRGKVGEETFGFDRYLNQVLYRSKEWKNVRDYVIARDSGLDLGVEGRVIVGRILVHHMNPITVDDILTRIEYVLNPEYLISTMKSTHDAIHYGDASLLLKDPVERYKNDTCPWKH